MNQEQARQRRAYNAFKKTKRKNEESGHWRTPDGSMILSRLTAVDEVLRLKNPGV